MRLKLFILFILIRYMGIGQGLNVELGFNDNFAQTTRGVVCVDEYSYMVKFQLTSASASLLCTLYKIDTLGNILWSAPINPKPAEYIDVYEILPSEDGGIYLMGYGVPVCDYPQNCYWFIQKYNSSGSIVWTRIWTNLTFWKKHLSGLSLDSSNLLFVNYNDSSGTYLNKIGAGGITLDSVAITKSELKGFEALSGFEKVAFKQDSLFGFDTIGNVSKSIIFYTQIQNIKSLNDTLYVLTKDSIYLYNNNLQIIYANKVTGFSGYSNLKFINGSIRFISQGATTQSIIRTNHQLQPINTLAISLEIDSITHKDFNEYHFSTGINYKLSMYEAIRYLDYSLNSGQNAFVNTTDIGVLDLVPTYVNAIQDAYYPDIYKISVEADVLIKNFGTNTLNSCRINHYIKQTVLCSDDVYSEQFLNLNLAAGDSIWISLGLIHTETNFYPNDTIRKNICIYTSHPNLKTDLNVVNDNYCESVLIGFTGIDEKEVSEFSLYPNPTSGIINLQLPDKNNAAYSIYNMQGSLIMSGDICSNKVDISSLSNGLYFLRILFNGGQTNIARIIIKE